jgi:hypothetical protein
MKKGMQNDKPELNTPELPQKGLVRLKQILQAIPVTASTWWYWVRQGRAAKTAHSN